MKKNKNIEKAAALGVILTAKEKNFIQVNMRCFLVEESHVILDKYIAKKKLQNIIRRYSHFPTALFDTDSVKHALSSTDIYNRVAESSFHLSSYPNLGACGKHSEYEVFGNVCFSQKGTACQEVVSKG